jgi:hypothetical protein
MPASWPRSDSFVCAIVGLFSVINGYFAVLVYEYASNKVSSRLLSLCFFLFSALLL